MKGNPVYIFYVALSTIISRGKKSKIPKREGPWGGGENKSRLRLFSIF